MIDYKSKDRMYYLLNLFEDDYDPKKSIIFLGEKSKKLLRSQRMTLP